MRRAYIEDAGQLTAELLSAGLMHALLTAAAGLGSTISRYPASANALAGLPATGRMSLLVGLTTGQLCLEAWFIWFGIKTLLVLQLFHGQRVRQTRLNYEFFISIGAAVLVLALPRQVMAGILREETMSEHLTEGISRLTSKLFPYGAIWITLINWANLPLIPGED